MGKKAVGDRSVWSYDMRRSCKFLKIDTYLYIYSNTLPSIVLHRSHKMWSNNVNNVAIYGLYRLNYFKCCLCADLIKWFNDSFLLKTAEHVTRPALID